MGERKRLVVLSDEGEDLSIVNQRKFTAHWEKTEL
jgi:hypothetical protein